jgi:small subunit ribosomal protein S7
MLSTLRTQRQLLRRISTAPSPPPDAAVTINNALSQLGVAVAPTAVTPASLTPKAASKILSIPPPEDPLLQLVVSLLQDGGKRHQASKQVTTALQHIHAMTRAPPLPILREAVLKASPAIRCKTIKWSTKRIIIPIPLSERQRTRTGVKWLLEASKRGMGKTFEERFAREIISVFNSVEGQPTGGGMKLKHSVHQEALVNRSNVGWLPPRSRR